MVELRVQINKPEVFGELETTLTSWLHVVREYTNRAPRDSQNRPDYCYWHRERSHVGFLATAAWLNGWAVLQEWSMKKGETSGRNDLWLGRGQAQLFIEAKHGWCRVDRQPEELEKEIKAKTDLARDSACRIIQCEGTRVAAAFVSAICPGTPRVDFEGSRIRWLGIVSKAADAVAVIAHCQDECPKDLRNNWCMGIALLLSKV
jgi:hypothetical protein